MTRHVTRSTLPIAVAGLTLALAACGSTTKVSTSGSTSASSTSTTSTSSSSASPSTTTSRSASPTTTASSSLATPTVQGAVQQMNAGFAKTKSARVVAQEADGSDTIKIELAGTVDGKNQRGSVANHSTTDGGTVQFVVVDGKEYINGDAAYYKSTGGNGASYAGKWVIPPSTAQESFSNLTLKSLFDEMESDFSATKTTKMKLTTISENGAPAWQIADGETIGVIAADGSGHMLRAEHTEGGKTEKYVFDQWDAVPPVTAPAGAIQAS